MQAGDGIGEFGLCDAAMLHHRITDQRRSLLELPIPDQELADGFGRDPTRLAAIGTRDARDVLKNALTPRSSALRRPLIQETQRALGIPRRGHVGDEQAIRDFSSDPQRLVALCRHVDRNRPGRRVVQLDPVNGENSAFGDRPFRPQKRTHDMNRVTHRSKGLVVADPGLFQQTFHAGTESSAARPPDSSSSDAISMAISVG